MPRGKGGPQLWRCLTLGLEKNTGLETLFLYSVQVCLGGAHSMGYSCPSAQNRYQLELLCAAIT